MSERTVDASFTVRQINTMLGLALTQANFAFPAPAFSSETATYQVGTTLLFTNGELLSVEIGSREDQAVEAVQQIYQALAEEDATFAEQGIADYARSLHTHLTQAS